MQDAIKKLPGATDAALRYAQLIPYGTYVASYYAMRYAKQHPSPMTISIRPLLVALQAGGLAGDAAIDKLRRKSMWDDGDEDDPAPNEFRWVYGKQTYLPGMGVNEETGKRRIDFQKPW